MSQENIELATPHDAAAVHAVHRAAWAQTYPALGVSGADIEARFHDPARAIDDEQRRLASPVTRSWVARVGGRLVGYCRAAGEGDTGRIESIYVLAGHQSRGIGGALLGRALEWLGPDRDVFVDTHRANRRAHAFYRRFGFAPTGLVKDTARSGAVMLASGEAFPDVEMVRSGRRPGRP